MGLTKAQLWERAYKRLTECVNQYCTPVKKSKLIKSKWDKYPMIAKDICVIGVYVTKDDKILLTDYDFENDTYPVEEGHYRFAEELEREYLDAIVKQINETEISFAVEF